MERAMCNYRVEKFNCEYLKGNAVGIELHTAEGRVFGIETISAEALYTQYLRKGLYVKDGEIMTGTLQVWSEDYGTFLDDQD